MQIVSKGREHLADHESCMPFFLEHRKMRTNVTLWVRGEGVRLSAKQTSVNIPFNNVTCWMSVFLNNVNVQDSSSPFEGTALVKGQF